MILGDRITKLREELHLTKKDLAEIIGVTVATINNWENSKSTPSTSNLQFLANVLDTTTDYLQGIAGSPENPRPNVCEICGTPVPERLRKCPACRWKTKWPESLLNSPELASRRKRSHLVRLLSLDRDKPEAVFGSSTDKNRTTYITTLETCTCRDFEMTRGKIPCKHILRLAGELGLFESENFASGEDDYTLHTASPNDAPKSECTFHKNGFVEVAFQPVLGEGSMDRPFEDIMAEWKAKLLDCKTADECTQLITGWNLTNLEMMLFADYLGVDLRGCKTSEIIQRLIESILPRTNQALPAKIVTSPPELPAVLPEPVKPESQKSPGIFMRLLKYALCCFFGLFGIVPVVVAVEGDKVARCFSVAFVIAGILTAITARRKGENSAFKWWLYGALVPIVSWIDVVMLGAESKAKAFIKGLTFSVFGVFGFMTVLSAFVLPDPPKKPLQIEASVTPAVSVDVEPVSVSSEPAPKVSTDAEISAARAKQVEELRKASAEYERQQQEQERQQQAERKRIEQEYLKKANTVVVTSRGKKYHDPDCPTVKGTYRELTIAQARKKGYRPCDVCDPPEQTVTHANIYWGDNVYTSGKVKLDVD